MKNLDKELDIMLKKMIKISNSKSIVLNDIIIQFNIATTCLILNPKEKRIWKDLLGEIKNFLKDASLCPSSMSCNALNIYSNILDIYKHFKRESAFYEWFYYEE